MGILRMEIPRVGSLALIGSALCLALVATPSGAQPCAGDCDGNQTVAINELISCVNIALGTSPVSTCTACDVDGDGTVAISELIQAVTKALNGCGGTTNCPLQAGFYTVTQVAGGELTTATLSPFPFPPGGTLKEDVSEPDANCVHSVVVPFPGGFNSPVFCVPALGFTVSVVQTACGVGQLDSDGGSDYTVTEAGDTSDASSTCNLPNPGCNQGMDSSIRIDVTVGDGAPDTCSEGSANAIVAIPVHTTTWIEHTSGDFCGIEPGADGTFDPGPDPVTDDLLVVDFPQILDFTTDKSTTTWSDLDGDGCFLAGRGPAAGFVAQGKCLDLTAKTLTTVATGPIGSAGSPLFDLAYRTILPNTFSGPEASTGATCPSPPDINFTGVAHQCIH
jgi:hypothetical protein